MGLTVARAFLTFRRYTHDMMLPDDVKDGNLYYECNNALRVRGAQARQAAMNTWGIYGKACTPSYL